MKMTSRPQFLDYLDSDPDRAFADFYRFARRLLQARPPRPYLGLMEPDREDVFHTFVLSCTRDDFRALKEYQDRGKPFAAWLYTLVHNRCIDRLRQLTRLSGGGYVGLVTDDPDEVTRLPDTAPGVAERLESAEIVAAVRRVMATLGDRCKLLLEMAADGATPREMVAMLRLPTDHNKKVSDDLRYCRKRLKDGLAVALSYDTWWNEYLG